MRLITETLSRPAALVTPPDSMEDHQRSGRNGVTSQPIRGVRAVAGLEAPLTEYR